MDTFYADIFGQLMSMQPLPIDLPTLLGRKPKPSTQYRTAVYVHDNGSFSVFCKHSFVRHYESPQDLPPEIAINLGFVATQSDEPMFKDESPASLESMRHVWSVWGDVQTRPEAPPGKWVSPHLYCVLVSDETHEEIIANYVTNFTRDTNDTRGKGKGKGKKNTG